MKRADIRSLFGIELPIIQAPMAGVQDSALAIAVSNAGGLGSLPCAMLDAATLRKELELIRAGTRKPFNVNFFCHRQPKVDPERERQWRALLAPYFAELGIDPQVISAAPSRAPFSAETAEIIAEFEPPVVSFHFGLPSEDLLQRVRKWGAKVISTATTIDEARWLADRGVDAVIAQGLEAGGHRGHFLRNDLEEQLGTLDLFSKISRSTPLPIIAAGGIAEAADAQAAILAGAAGVQIGSAYLLCPEARTSVVHRNALKHEEGRMTAITNLFSGRPARGIVNRLMNELGPVNSAAPEFPLAAAGIAPLRSKAERLSKGDFSPLWAGEKTRDLKEMLAAELTRAFIQKRSI